MGATIDIDGSYLTLQKALDIARNSESGVDPAVATYLERSLQAVWVRLNANPNSYIFSKEEFSLFNYFRARFNGLPLAQRAVKRFWDHFEGDPNDLEN